MKYTKFKLPIFILIPVFWFFSIQSKAQDIEPIKARMSLQYNNISGKRILKSTIKAKEGRKYIFLPMLPIDFNILVDTGSIFLGTVISNEVGTASFEVSEDFFNQYNFNGVTSFESSFIGSEKYKEVSSEISISDIKLNLSFSQEEEEKQIILTAFKISEGQLYPITEDLEINFYVPRTFTLFKVGSKTLQNGTAIIPFPIDLPGDTLGNMEVISKLEDNESYGNVEVSSSINWGAPQKKNEIKHRGLGDTDAPLWMVYTLIVLLSFVWFHYLYVIYSIYLIKKESRKNIVENIDIQ